jgi:cell division protein FtsB
MPRIRPLLRLTASLLLATLGATTYADPVDSTASDEAADRQAIQQAWEKIQKADPLTVTFEQTAPGTYHLKTTRFPYDGTVHIGGIVIRELPGTTNGATRYAAVEPTLDQDNARFASQYPESFNDWRSRNSFYYKPQEKAWVDSADMKFTPSTDFSHSANVVMNSFYLFIGAFVLLIIGLIALRLRESRAVQKRFKQAEEVEKRTLTSLDRTEAAREQTLKGYETQQKSHDLLIEQTRLLQEILDTLKQPKQ